MPFDKTENRVDLVIPLVTLALLIIGLIMVYSAKLYIDQSYLTKQLIRILIGFGALVVGYAVPLSALRRWGWATIPLLIGALLVVRLSGSHFGGAERSYHGIQPAEFAKPMLAIFLAYYYQRLEHVPDARKSLGRFVLVPLLCCLPVIALIVLQPAVSMALVVTIMVASLLYLAEVRWRHLLPLGVLAILAFGAVVVKFPHTLARVQAYSERMTHILDVRPELNHSSSRDRLIDWQQRQSWIGIGSGGSLGRGPGNGKQKFYFLPKVTTDFIFALIGEEWGFIFGSLLIFGLYALFLWRGVFLIRNAPDMFSRLLTAGIVLAIIYTALIHLGVTLRLLPPTGQTLPFVSYGASAVAANMFGVGMILKLSKEILRRPVENDLVSSCWNWWAHLSGARAR
jgi:cell division protein FtsW